MSRGRPGSGTGFCPARRSGLQIFNRRRSVRQIGVVSVLLLGLMLMAGGLYLHAVIPIGIGMGLIGVGAMGVVYLRQVKIGSMGRPGLGELDR